MDFANPFPIFQRAMRIITAIEQGPTTLVTTSFAHQYMTGLIVRLVIPLPFGMPQINNMIGAIVVNSPTTFYIDIDSTQFYPFIIPDPYPSIGSPQSIPVGELSEILTEATQNVLPYP